jgi:methylenetetrahydrofolate reductase (NADPH)
MVDTPTNSSRPLKNTLRDLWEAGDRSFSFEFFPPKDDTGEELLWATVRDLEELSPTFVSVTYGAGGSTQDRTTRITAELVTGTTLTPMAHLTCVGASREELRQVIGAYSDAGIDAVMALRGDPPGGPGQPWTPQPGGFNHAIDLVRLLRSMGDFTIGVAAFPDKHPESASLDVDARVLVEKADAGADFAVTQFFFDAEAYFDLVERVSALGCRIPVIPGIIPVTNIRQIQRYPELSGKPLPDWLVRRLESVADDPEGVRQVGVEVAADLSRKLLDGGAPGLHFYTLNRSRSTLDVVDRLGIASRSPLS